MHLPFFFSISPLVKRFIAVGFLLVLIGPLSVPSAHAVATSVLPQAGDPLYCEAIFTYGDPSLVQAEFEKDDSNWSGLLGCAVKMGKVKFWMVPYFVNYILEFLITLSGVLVVLMIVIGGYFYIYGAVTEDKDKGKTIIRYAISGYVLVLSSWFIVNVILVAISS